LDNEFGDNTDFDPLDGQRDEAQDGQLKAVVKGGKQFNGSANNGVPYKYTWKKQDASGVWQTLSNQTSVIAVALSNGNYAINVEDANGNVLGTSANNITTPVDVLYFFQQPDKLQLSFSVTDITCNSGANGSLTANVSGGTLPYTYSWTNGESNPTLNNLTSGNYFVQITDARGCTIQGSKAVQQPGEIEIAVLTQKNPTCFGGNDGLISVNVAGGVPPYQTSWNTGSTVSQISDLTAGTYTITVKDGNNCTAVQNYTLIDPPQYTINLGADRTLCNEQSHHLDATISDPNATYQWTSTNGFTATSAQIEVTQAGTYHVKAASSLGCIAEDEVVIGKSTVGIDSRYIISNQAYSNEEIVLVNVSNPKAESTQWIFPPQTEIISQNDTYANIKLENVGEYDITLRSTQGACYQDYTHRIKVEKKGDLPEIGNTSNPFIKEFTLAPNPNNGNFTIIIDLADTSTVSLRIIDMAGAYVAQEKILNGQKIYTVDYTLSALTAGVYLIILETPKGTVVKRMIKF
jgi:ligand-binding SRPBCC domain-containing protein